jgi:hypothetical protein
MQSCHYSGEGQIEFRALPSVILTEKRPFERANGPSLGRKRPYWAAGAKNCFFESAGFVCACSHHAATYAFFLSMFAGNMVPPRNVTSTQHSFYSEHF